MKCSWQTKEGGAKSKSRSWYIAVGVVALGGAIASFITGNILLGILVVLGGFAIMLAGSIPHTEHRCALSEQGVHVDARIIPWAGVSSFSIDEKAATPILRLETGTLLGIIVLPLSGIDFREIRTELKNRNIEEVDSLETFAESITRALGL